MSKRVSNKKRGNHKNAQMRLQSASNNADVWASRLPARSLSFLPRRMINVMVNEIVAYYATATAQNTGNFCVNASSFSSPYSNVTNAIGSAASRLTVTVGFSNTQNAIGANEMSFLYQYYKVRKSGFKVRAVCGSVNDAVYMTCFPSPNQIAANDPFIFGGQPYSKRQLISGGADPVTMSQKISSPTVLGWSATQFEGYLPTQLGSAPAVAQEWYWNFVWASVNSGGNPAGDIYFEIELTQECEFSEPIAYMS